MVYFVCILCILCILCYMTYKSNSDAGAISSCIQWMATNIYHHINSQDSTISHQEHSDDGQNTVRSDVSVRVMPRRRGKNVSTTPTISPGYLEPENQLTSQQPCATPASAPRTKKKTSSDKKPSCPRTPRGATSSQTSLPVSTGTDPVSSPFWTESTAVISKQLWSPSKTDSVDLASSYWNGSLKRLMQKSWFSTKVAIPVTSPTNCQKTYLQSLPSLLRETMASVRPSTKGPEMRAYKIRLYPTQSQRQTLTEWFGVRRWIYNSCLYHIKTEKAKISLKALRELFIKNHNYKTPDKEWMLKYTFDLRDEALRDLMKNLNSNFKKGTQFDLKYIRKKDATQSMSILKKWWKQKNGSYASVLCNLKATEILPTLLYCDSRLIKTATNKYYMCLPVPLEQPGENQANVDKMIFIDPGVRQFLTGYDPHGQVTICGTDVSGRIARLLHYKNKLVSAIATCPRPARKRRLTMALRRHGERINNLITDLHRRAAKWLCENYQYIFIPRMNFHQFRHLHRKPKTMMATLSHCRFLNRLTHKSRVYRATVVEVDESFTSKTCSHCGWQYETLGRSSVFVCRNCDFEIDRDMNAAKNIMLRYITERFIPR